MGCCLTNPATRCRPPQPERLRRADRVKFTESFIKRSFREYPSCDLWRGWVKSTVDADGMVGIEWEHERGVVVPVHHSNLVQAELPRNHVRAGWSTEVSKVPHGDLVNRTTDDQHVYCVLASSARRGCLLRLYIYWLGRLVRIDHLVGVSTLEDLRLDHDGRRGIFATAEGLQLRDKLHEVVHAIGRRVRTREANWTSTLL